MIKLVSETVVIYRKNEKVERISRDRVVTAPEPTRDGTPVRAAASRPITAPDEARAPDVASQPIKSYELSDISPPRISGAQPPLIGTAREPHMAKRHEVVI